MEAPVISDAPQFDKLIVEFYSEAVIDEKASWGWKETALDPETGNMKVVKHHPGAGREVYRDAEFIEIRIPGNLKEIRRREVRPSDRVRYPREYAAFKQGLKDQVFGTPLEKLTPHVLSKAQVKDFQAVGIRTAENLRDIPDGDGQKFIGFAQIKQKVTDYLKALEGQAPLELMRHELAQRDQEIAGLKAAIAEAGKRKGKAE